MGGTMKETPIPEWATALGVMTRDELADSKRAAEQAEADRKARALSARYAPARQSKPFEPSEEWLKKRST